MLGVNTYRWPKDVPFSYGKHPEVMERYWQTCIDAFKDYEVVWTVGYRGKHDRPFWMDEPEIRTSEQRGSVISKTIARQVEMIRKVHPDAPMITNMWSEGADLFHQGHIKLPAGVTLVWPDNGAGIIRDNGRVKPGRICNQIGRFARAGATDFLLVNVSDIRPVPLSTECAMKLAWDAKPYLDKSDEENLKSFLDDWSRRQFGAEVGGAISGIYREYFACPYMDDSGLKGEHWLHRKLRQLHETTYPQVAAGKPLGDETGRLSGDLLRFSSENRAYMEKLLGKAELLSPVAASGRRDFYQGHVLTQIQIHLQSLLALQASCQAMTAYGAGDKATAITRAATALEACDRLYSELHKAEYGKWVAWYADEKLVGLDRTRGRVEIMLAALKGDPAPVGSPLWSEYHYHSLYHYQERFSKNFPLLYPKE